ncbi:MAG: DEAD/DEAH box helicase family protein [Candidatus Vogelbacteria bacterium]|nr:DEAD/DEAH box helicase family protein [Candidatus Vogelbacteria bacterium]
MQEPNGEQFRLFTALFRGRQDVYARYWEKDGRSGYSPAYTFDWNEFNEHRSKGGLLKTFQNKKTIPLSLEIIGQHLTGKIAIGIYPILEDNTSYFLAADFDGNHWLDDARAYMNVCTSVNLNAYLERSKSGTGGHVWIFFSEPYPCWKSRRIGLEVVRRALGLSIFEKEISFDRLFPNQDDVPKGGFGNLIALPLQGQYARSENTLFVDPANEVPYLDQWGFLASVHKYSIKELDAALKLLDGEETLASHTGPGKSLVVYVSKQLRIPRARLTPATVEFLKEKLNFLNTEYLTKKRLGISLYKVQKYFKLINESNEDIFLPRGFLNQLIAHLESEKIAFELVREHMDFKPVEFKSILILRPGQEQAVNDMLAADQGVLVAPPGSGKTMIGMELIARRQLPALILVHRKQLLDQWVDRIQTYLGIPKAHIGCISGTSKKIGKGITVGLLQSLARHKNITELSDSFGTIIADECHHIPAKTFREVIANLNSQYLYGLTATPKRKHNDEQLIYVYIGDILSTMQEADQPDLENPGEKRPKPKIIIRETELEIPFHWKTDHFQLLAKIISFDTARNRLIAKDIIAQVESGNKILVLSERKEHLEILTLCLKGHAETIVISGDDSAPQRTSKLKQINDGHYQVILSTGQFFGEGLHVSDVSTLVLAFPFSFEGKLIQYIGRLMHGATPKFVFDYRDRKIPFLERQFKQRERYYKKMNSL